MATPLFPQQIIARKRDGRALSREEIESFVRGAVDGSWADYQLSAMLMAIVIRGMGSAETIALTQAMVHSGSVADLHNVRRAKADKHSTGGVGDKVSLHLAPMIAACGVAVPMITGRGLGHTGGTLDKLESIRGFRAALSLDEYARQVKSIGLAIVGQTPDLVPADRKLYALRDVTGTVESIPLICSSILSKKLAEGTDVLVGDVKFGRGAFMKERADAAELANQLVAVCRGLGTPMRAVLSCMDQPIGRAVGNALEVQESIDCLKGRGPADTMELTFALGTQMLLLAKAAKFEYEARANLEKAISSGAAEKKFRDMIEAQDGDPRVIDEPSRLPSATIKYEFKSARSGFIQEVDAMGVALAALRLGAGRARTEDKIDHAVGLSDLVKIGERVELSGRLCTIHANDEASLAEAQAMMDRAIVIGDRAPEPTPMIAEIIG